MSRGKKKKASTKTDVPPALDFRFVDGPRDGTSLRLANPPRRFIRLAFPDWCTYEFDGEVYRYFGPDPIPAEDRGGW